MGATFFILSTGRGLYAIVALIGAKLTVATFSKLTILGSIRQVAAWVPIIRISPVTDFWLYPALVNSFPTQASLICESCSHHSYLR